MNSNELIDKEFTLDLGSTPVKVVIKNITKDKVIVEYLNSTPGRMEEFTISDFEYLAMVKIDNNKDPLILSQIFYTRRPISIFIFFKFYFLFCEIIFFSLKNIVALIKRIQQNLRIFQY
jgi:hypothetical protein